jgi:cytochrome c biogenesis protein CcmG/thiol:disulfide interchange protein DsbE
MKSVLAFLAGISLCIASDAMAIAEGQSAPSLDAKLLDGHSFSLADQIGKVVVINFWASWCPPCREEMPAFDAYYRAHHADGLEMIAISMDDPADESKARTIMASYKFPAAIAREASFKGYGRIWRIPLTFVIDRRGVLRKDGWYGDPGISATSLEQVVTPLLAEKPH